MFYLRDLNLGVGDVVKFMNGSTFNIVKVPPAGYHTWRMSGIDFRYGREFPYEDTLKDFTVVSRAKRDYTIEEFL